MRDIFIDRKDLKKKIGILDPEGIEKNPLTGENYSENYKSLGKMWSNFPMYEKSQEIIQKIYDQQVILIVSSTGSGKTVITPKYALHALNYQAKIAITNPKRIPSAENAKFAAKTLDVELGGHVGYKYRGSPDGSSSQDTKLLYCTDGYVLARLQRDPMLMDYDVVIIDEARADRLSVIIFEAVNIEEAKVQANNNECYDKCENIHRLFS